MPPDSPPTATQSDKLLDILSRNWLLEMDGAAMYGALAEREHIPERKKIFRTLSSIEKKHADSWARRISELGGELPDRDAGTSHSVRVTDASSDMRKTLDAVIAEERRDVNSYLRQLSTITDEETRRILRATVLDEFSHAHTLSRMRDQSGTRSALDYLTGRRRQTSGSWIGDAVYGVNDGLGSIFGIVSGVSGATLGNSKYVLLAGVAGMIASALSMGCGAFLAAKSEREIFEAAIDREKQNLEQHADAAREEMAILYQLKGVPHEESVRIAELLAADPAQFLKTMAAEKLNLTEDALSNPISSGVTGSISTAIGAIVPVTPFFFLSGVHAVIAAAAVSLVAHFAVGAAKSLVTVRSWWSSGWEMTLVGAAEGVVTYVIGIGLGRVGA